MSAVTDRFAGLTVVLTADTRPGDTQALIDAIRMLKGVQGVVPLVATPDLYIAEQRAYVRMRNTILRALRDMQGAGGDVP